MPSMPSTGTFLRSNLSLSLAAADRESSEVGVVEIEPSSESFEDVDEVDSRWRCRGRGGEGRTEAMDAGSMSIETTGEVSGV